MIDHDAIAARVRQDREAGALFSGPVYIKLADMADAYLDLYDDVQRLRAALELAKQAFQNQDELNLLPSQHRQTVRDLAEKMHAALKGDSDE